MSPARLARASEGRLLLGVCAGLADWWRVDRTLLRVLFVLASVCSAAFPGILVYLVLAIVLPPADPPTADRPKD